MVSAVFHSPLEAAAPAARSGDKSREPSATYLIADDAHTTGTTAQNSMKITVPAAAPAKSPRDASILWQGILPPLLGMGLLVLVWELVSMGTGASIPSPKDTFIQAIEIFRDPFYSKGPNDQGVGWNVLSSLKRVAMGFGLAAVVGIPVGFMIGRFTFLSRMFNPLISLLRPVSPLAWLPIGLLVFKGADPAAIWTIFICSIWPMII
ncbi:MAG TPA: nitrate ABC transporter, permease protein, partial [Polaromonas sp.]|nr:nitrate ABC transporter, permease protein [Polaromonas sp.]